MALSVTAFAADTAYDGGKATNPKDLNGKKVVLSDVPKLVGIGYFNATAKGIADACAEMSKNGIPTDVSTDAPTEGDIQKQMSSSTPPFPKASMVSFLPRMTQWRFRPFSGKH